MGCTELAKYLFYGLYGVNQPNMENALDEFPEEMLDGEFPSFSSSKFYILKYLSPLKNELIRMNE